MDVDLSVELDGLRLANPVVTASGCFGAGREMARTTDLGALGAVVCKTVTFNPRLGITPPRGAETPSGMLNAIGLQNPGVKAFRDNDLAWLVSQGVPAIASVGGHSVHEYVACVEQLLNIDGLTAIELNLSCPNLEERGYMFALSAERAAEVTAEVKRVADVPIFVKLSPDVTDLVSIAAAVIEARADGLSLINTTLGMAIDVESRRPRLSTATGGLSGPAIRPIAVRCVWQVHNAMPHVPIVGMGGIASARDALEFILAGASAVAIGTANFYDPLATRKVRDGIEEWMRARGVRSLREIRGQVKTDG